MTEKSKTILPEAPGIEELVKRYVASPQLPRLLMRFWATDRPLDLVRDIAAPLRVHASEARRGLRVLTQDGFVTVREELGGTTYILTRDPAARALASQVLRGAIERGGQR